MGCNGIRRRSIGFGFEKTSDLTTSTNNRGREREIIKKKNEERKYLWFLGKITMMGKNKLVSFRCKRDCE